VVVSYLWGDTHGMPARATAAFVGRPRELDELNRALAAARVGRGVTILISGEPGIGKTRLAAEVMSRARADGFDVLLGRSIDLIGTELAYLPFIEALRSLGEVGATGSQLQAFESTLALLAARAAVTPVLLVLEDVHWADASSLDLLVYLSHNLEERPVVLLATYRPDDADSLERMRGLADRVRRSGAAMLLELGPLSSHEVAALLADDEGAPPTSTTETIFARSGGNPFFALELRASAAAGELPPRLRDMLTGRLADLDRLTRSLLRVAAAAGRDVSYSLLVAVIARPDRDVRESLRAAVEHGVLVADQERGQFRFRHALLAEAVYATILPGEREWVHARLADELARDPSAGPAELAPHWALAGRSADALRASVAAALDAQDVFGLAEALSHVERALSLWHAVPDAAAVAGLDLAELCTWGAELASQLGAGPRAVELAQRAMSLLGATDVRRPAQQVRVAEYLYEVGEDDAALAALQRAVEIVPTQPPTGERAYALASLAGGLMLAGRREESMRVAELALDLAQVVGAGEAEVRARTVLAGDLAYLGGGDHGIAQFRHVLRLAAEIGDHWGLDRAYVNFTDALTMLGRPREAAELGREGIEVLRRYGIHSPLIVANRIEALLATGDWQEADAVSGAALRVPAASYQDALFILRAELDLGRGRFPAAHAHLETARKLMRRGIGLTMTRYLGCVAELALWERRWSHAREAVDEGLELTTLPADADSWFWLCAEGLRALAELAALARARRDDHTLASVLGGAAALIEQAAQAAAEAAAVRPNTAGWLALAKAEYGRVTGTGIAEMWECAAEQWDRLERPPLAAYSRWRQAETLVTAGAPRREATVALRIANAVATRLGAQPLLREIGLLAERARLDPTSPATHSTDATDPLRDLGLTSREVEVLALVAGGRTNREIATELVISVKTAGVHVSHILHKLGAANRIEAAAIAHRIQAP
jgi:DNA-binding CsgD family transcriptional regulator/tetratricopeptide (TPR) repeat protein